jgi:hypothetical protein
MVVLAGFVVLLLTSGTNADELPTAAQREIFPPAATVMMKLPLVGIPVSVLAFPPIESAS